MYAYGAGSSGEGRPYQGYPYTNPIINDVATIDAATAARWSALPRRPGVPVRVNEQPGGSRQDVNNIPTQTPRVEEEQDPEESSSANKIDYDANPVVYIELPESSGSEVAEQRRPPAEESFVQQTIFYDQFKDCTVVTVSDDNQSNGSSSSGSTPCSRRPYRPTRPAPPVTLSLGSPDGYPSSSMRVTPGAPPIMSKESNVYGSYPVTDDNFQTQIPDVREFPNPPPAYSEYDTLSATPGTLPPITCQPTRPTQTQTPPLSRPQTQSQASQFPQNSDDLPRTQVIVPPIGKKTKVIYCRYCGVTLPTLIIKQVGFATHIVAMILFLVGLFPCTLIVYYFDCCRYRNHYCKQCNKLIAYEIPFLGKDVTYV